VKYVRYKARMIRAFIGLGLVVSLLVMLTGCWPFNTFPVAYFTASPLSGPAPLSVAFSAMLSEDPDGFIAKWEWDFGDGSSGSGESISHTYTTAGTSTVVLRVTDDDRATATAQRTITVTAAEEPGGGYVQRICFGLRRTCNYLLFVGLWRRGNRHRNDYYSYLCPVGDHHVQCCSADHRCGQHRGYND